MSASSKDQAQSTYLFTAGSRLEHTQVEIEEFMQPSNECVVKWHAKACDLNLLQSSVFWSGTHAVHRQLEVNRRSTEMDPNIAFFFPCQLCQTTSSPATHKSSHSCNRCQHSASEIAPASTTSTRPVELHSQLKPSSYFSRHWHAAFCTS